MSHTGELVFPMAEYERRLRSLRLLMAQRRMDAVILTMPHDLFYLTGYQTPGYYWFQALVVPLEKEPFMVTRRLEWSNVLARTWITEAARTTTSTTLRGSWPTPSPGPAWRTPGWAAIATPTSSARSSRRP